MKRWTGRIVICLLLGAVTTVAVAWALLLWVDLVRVAIIFEEEHGAYTHLRLPMNGVGRHRDELLRIRHVLPRSSDELEPFDGDVGSRDDSGWPALCLTVCAFDPEMENRMHIAHGSRTSSGSIYWTFHAVQLEGGIRISPYPATPGYPARWRALPLIPRWPGFTFNTIFYAVLWFALLFGFKTVRGVIRHRYGRCPNCGYDLRGEFDNGCSECGWNRAEERA